jgi:hypothetical protein
MRNALNKLDDFNAWWLQDIQHMGATFVVLAILIIVAHVLHMPSARKDVFRYSNFFAYLDIIGSCFILLWFLYALCETDSDNYQWYHSYSQRVVNVGGVITLLILGGILIQLSIIGF